MKKLIVLLTAALVAATTTGCGGGSSMFTYIARSNSDSTPHLFKVHGTKGTPEAVAITIPQDAAFVSANHDGTAVTYCHNSDSGYEIFLMGTDSVEKQLTTGANACESVFSPDGKTIAYVNAAGDEPGIFTMNVDGSNQKALYVAPVNTLVQLLPEFSPDGKSLVFFVAVNNGFVVGPTPARPLSTQVPGWPAAKSNQRKTVAHGTVQPPPGTPTVTGWYTMALTASHPTLVFTPQNWWGPAVYSADSKKILFTDYDGTEWNVFSVKMDGTGVTQLTTSTTTEVFSPVAYKDKILFNQYNGDTQSFDIYVMDQTGEHQTLVHSTANTYETLNDTYYSNF
jgi:Tol biopolymer transport system component